MVFSLIYGKLDAMKLTKKIIVFCLFVGLFTLMASYQICLSDGCVFVPENPTCQNGGCVNEGIISHLQERASFLTAAINNNWFQIIQLFILVIFFLVISYSKSVTAQHWLKFRKVIKNHSLEHNLLSILFAKGVLHRKIY